MLAYSDTIRKVFYRLGQLYSSCLKVIKKKIQIKTLCPEKNITSCAAKTLENSLFMAYGRAVCALEP